jgi:phosphohistidine swiveling domain-containing protein
MQPPGLVRSFVCGEDLRVGYVRPLEGLDLEDAPLVGAKTAVLGHLLRQGIPVPEGFAVEAAAFDAWVAHNGLEPILEDPEAASGTLSPHNAPLPDDLAAELRRALEDLACPAVAVRSSAIGEDAATASFAGMLTTYLGVATPDQLVTRVRDVFASGLDRRVLAYSGFQVGTRRHLRVGCLVQRMLAPDTAGILFTAHPVTGSPERLALSAVAGLGEALVSGQRSGDYFELRRADLSVASQRIEGAAPVITPETTREIGRLGLRLEQELGAPQDVEWACVAGHIYVLQARPITTARPPSQLRQEVALADEIERLSVLDSDLVFSNLFTAELMPTPTPATLELLRAMARPGAGVMSAFHEDLGLCRFRHALQVETICGRLYFELGSLARIIADAGFPIEPRYLRQPPGAEEHVELDRGWLQLQVGRLLLLWPLYLWRAARVVWRGRALLARFGERYRRELLPQLERLVERDLAIEYGQLDDVALAAHADELHRWLAGEGRRVWEIGNQTALLSLGILAVQTRWHLGDRDGSEAARLTRGAPGNETLEMNRALLWLAATGDPDDRDRFLARFGHRAATELELAEPRWSEAPGFIDATLQRFRDRPPSDPLEADAEASPRSALPRCGPCWSPLAWIRRRLLRGAIATARRNAWLRETPKFHYLRRFEQLRRAYLEMGRRLHARELLDRADDVFFLYRSEIASAGSGTRALARERRERRRLLLSIPLPPTIRLADVHGLGRPIPTEARSELRGMGVSPGRFVGTACVVRELDEGYAFPDDAVLVATRTDPAWTPLFLAVGAVVVEVGSPLSHSAIVAREYGLPAVVNVTDATRRIATGQRLLVDGDAGTVALLGEESDASGPR